MDLAEGADAETVERTKLNALIKLAAALPNEGGDPARLVLRDGPLLISILLWLIADILLLYF